MKKLFVERLIYLKTQSKKSYNQIERELGYPRNSLQSYKNGRDPSAYRAVEIAIYFNVSVEYLLGFSVDE